MKQHVALTVLTKTDCCVFPYLTYRAMQKHAACVLVTERLRLNQRPFRIPYRFLKDTDKVKATTTTKKGEGGGGGGRQ